MKHPEQNDDEVFITNVFEEGNYESIGWYTKRKGVIAYTVDGNVLNFGYPVFVKRIEIIEVMNSTRDKSAKQVFKRMIEQ